MSPHLHIPLSRFHKTTRRPRWVVWLLGGLIVLFVVLLWQISAMWFTRLSGLKAAPDGTQVAVQLLVNKQTWPILEAVLSSTPLISNRNITLPDLAPFIEGDVTWFFGEDGSRSLAVSSKSELIPTSLLDRHHIVVQKVSSRVFLLSEKLQPISGMKARRSLSVIFPSFSTHMGAYVERDSKAITPILHKNRMISFELPGNFPNQKPFDSRVIPESGYLVLSTPVTSGVRILFPSMLKSILSEESRLIFENLLSSPGLIMLQNPMSPSFLLVSDQQTAETERLQIIQTLLVLKYPEKQVKYLPDQTVVQEIVSDPSLVSVEQRIISGHEFHHATTGTASLFMSKSGQVILTDNEEMLRSWLNQDTDQNLSKLCNANVAYLSVKKLLETNIYPTDRHAQDISRILLESFTDLSLETSGKSTVINLCY